MHSRYRVFPVRNPVYEVGVGAFIMFCSNRLTVRILFLACVIVLPIEAFASEGPPPVLNPKTYLSPSGEYRLHVDPSVVNGQGKGTYKLVKGANVLWSDTFPFTLWQAGVTDEGIVAGYAYTNGWRGFPPLDPPDGATFEKGPGCFHAVIITPEGILRLNLATKRKESRFLHTPPNPIAEGMFVDQDNDRFVIRMADEDFSRGEIRWWVYRLSDGKRLDDILLKRPRAEEKGGQFIVDAQPIQKTDLTLVHWDIRTENGGGEFGLYDPTGKIIWRRFHPNDYDVEGDQQAAYRLLAYVRSNGAILSYNEPRRFELWHVAERKRLGFEVALQPGSTSGWQIIHTSSEPHVGREVVAEKMIAMSPIDLQEIGRIRLGETSKPTPAIRNVRTFDFDSNGRIGFPRENDDGSFTFVLIEPDGTIVHELFIVNDKSATNARCHVAWLHNNCWIVIGIGFQGRYNSLWQVDIDAGMCQLIKDFDCPPVVESLASDREGGFVVRGDGKFDESGIIAFDREFKQRWHVRLKYHGPDILQFPEDVAVTTDGHVAVISPFTKLVQIYEKNGRFVRTIKLAKALGQEPSYPTGLYADISGGLIVEDWQGRPSIWRLRAESTVRSSFQPKYENGRITPAHFAVRVAPDGRMWTCDGTSLLRLDESGSVDLIVGNAPTPENIDNILEMTVDDQGRIYLVSDRTCAVHVFKKDGSFSHICTPLPSDFPGSVLEARVTVAGNGDVYVRDTLSWASGGYLRFDSKGMRIGFETEGSGGRHDWQRWHYVPGSRRKWIEGWKHFRLVDSDGNLLKKVYRCPNRDWLENVDELGVARDGSVAVAAHSGRYSGATQRTINLYGPEGEPIRTLALPFDDHIAGIAYYDDWVVIGRESDIVMMGTRNGELHKFTPQCDQKPRYWHPFSSPDGKEIWVIGGDEKLVRRYAIPGV